MKKRMFSLAILSIGLMTINCKDDESFGTNTSDLNLSLSGLENLGQEFVYEGWIIVDTQTISTGKFSIDDNGNLSKNTFEIDQNNLKLAEKFILTIEPSQTEDNLPSDVHVLAGDFSANTADLTLEHSKAITTDFSSAIGSYVLETPSTTITTDNNKGVWFLTPGLTTQSSSLTLPDLPTGWTYEGWATIEGELVSTGKFTDTTIADKDGNPYAGTDNTLPAFPGEDFIQGTSPNGVDFSTATHIEKISISVEPNPDNSPNPFVIKPLEGAALTETSPNGTSIHNLSLNTLNISGTATRE